MGTNRNPKGKPYGGWKDRYHFNAVGKKGFTCVAKNASARRRRRTERRRMTSVLESFCEFMSSLGECGLLCSEMNFDLEAFVKMYPELAKSFAQCPIGGKISSVCASQ